MAEFTLYDKRHRISRKRGDGLLHREVWVDHRGQVTRYSLAYINHALFGGDNGRVLGYDNQHGRHHRHMEPFDFVSFEDFEEGFQREWLELQRGRKT